MYVSPMRQCPSESSARENGLDRIEELGIHVMQNYTVVLRIQILSTCALVPTQGEDGSRESLGDQAWYESSGRWALVCLVIFAGVPT